MSNAFIVMREFFPLIWKFDDTSNVRHIRQGTFRHGTTCERLRLYFFYTAVVC
jgi:hypothetical protein